MFKKIIEALVTRVFKARYIYFSREDFLSARPGLKASSASIYDIALDGSIIAQLSQFPRWINST